MLIGGVGWGGVGGWLKSLGPAITGLLVLLSESGSGGQCRPRGWLRRGHHEALLKGTELARFSSIMIMKGGWKQTVAWVLVCNYRTSVGEIYFFFFFLLWCSIFFMIFVQNQKKKPKTLLKYTLSVLHVHICGDRPWHYWTSELKNAPQKTPQLFPGWTPSGSRPDLEEWWKMTQSHLSVGVQRILVRPPTPRSARSYCTEKERRGLRGTNLCQHY